MQPTAPPRILIADDQPDIIQALRLLLKGAGYGIETATSPASALAAAREKELDVVLMDLNYARDTTSGREGLDLIPQIRAADPSLPIVVMTAWGSVDGAVEAMRLGARDYVEKPWDNQRLLATLASQVELGRALRQTQRLEQENRRLRSDGLPEMIADSRAMQPVLRMMERVGPSDASVLITGEHGTGKDVVARWLHASSPRASRALVTVNAGAIAEGVFESELFGHVKGAFTDARTDRVGAFELADGGTLFLDEIGTMPHDQQAKLLRVLQSGDFQRVGASRTRKVDVRVISATNLDVAQGVAEGRFREDLLFRLNTVEIHLPALRDRREDVPLLANHFLRRSAAQYRKPLEGFSPDAMKAMLAYPWPGNVRELEHAVERAVLLATGPRVDADDLALRARVSASVAMEEMSLEDAERLLIRKALERFDGNVSQAAEALGLSRSALYRRLERFGL
ncbi:MAG: sigma-54-dependent Fis family transcriptional regulator [Gemmatimonadetes bacterium]|nr:sigma-54-dependent Fis family transcriptional regulator [Gemmatimonadota bacterium]